MGTAPSGKIGSAASQGEGEPRIDFKAKTMLEEYEQLEVHAWMVLHGGSGRRDLIADAWRFSQVKALGRD
jgi:hypothetical protein